MGGLFAAFAAELVLIAYRSANRRHGFPLPSELVAAVVIFGGLSLVAEASDGLAATTGWGLVVATALNVLPSSPGVQATAGAGAVNPGATPAQAYTSLSRAYPGLYGPQAAVPLPPPPALTPGQP